MRMSCNGCRVLRKGCSDSCSIRPCLQWLKNPESQANATVFLAKFYGRAGLMNLVNAGPENLRPAIFRSLLYEACGRIVNPIYGSVGLLWSGNWQLCQAAVEAVLKGAPIVQIATEAAASAPVPLLNKGAASYDIRHVSKRDAAAGHPRGESADDDLHRVHKATLPRFKRPGNPHRVGAAAAGDSAKGAASRPLYYHPETSDDGFDDDADDDSSATHPAAPNIDAIEAGPARAADGDNGSSMFSAETTPEGSMVTSPGAEQAKAGERTAGDDGEVELELTLGFEPLHHHSPRASSSSSSHSPARNPRRQALGRGGEACSVQLGLELGA